LRMRFVGQNAFDQLSSMRTDVGRPVHDARRRPFQMRLMALGTMLCMGYALVAAAMTEMGSHTLSTVENLDGRRGGAHLDRLAGERVGHTVPVTVEGDVVVDVDARLCPVTQVVPLRRQGL